MRWVGSKGDWKGGGWVREIKKGEVRFKGEVGRILLDRKGGRGKSGLREEKGNELGSIFKAD